MHKITLSFGDINEAVRQIEEYEQKLKQNVDRFLTQLLKYGVDIAKTKIVELGAIDGGELLNSISYMLYREDNRGILFTDCPHACYVEFGTGIVGAKSPHPTMPWEYDVNGHGEKGWYYYDTERGRIRFTKGMPSRPFMYETGAELERKAVDIAKEVFRQ